MINTKYVTVRFMFCLVFPTTKVYLSLNHQLKNSTLFSGELLVREMLLPCRKVVLMNNASFSMILFLILKSLQTLKLKSTL